MANSRITGKSRCSMKYNDIEKNPAEFKELVSNPKFVCRKCGRVAGDKKVLCKGKKIKSLVKGKSRQSDKNAA